jgi:hypothetical protein
VNKEEKEKQMRDLAVFEDDESTTTNKKKSSAQYVSFFCFVLVEYFILLPFFILSIDIQSLDSSNRLASIRPIWRVRATLLMPNRPHSCT